jgi:hypothetical protein
VYWLFRSSAPGLEVPAITNISVTNNVLTVTANNSFTVGASVTLIGLTTATFLNQKTVTITAATGTTFTAAFTNANYASAADTGFANSPINSTALSACATTATACTYTDSNVVAGLTYYYICEAQDATGSYSAPSNEAQATIPVAPPTNLILDKSN